MKKEFYLLCMFFGIIAGNAYAQSSSGLCTLAIPLCSDSSTFSSAVNTTAETGPNYGCVPFNQNPSWFYLKVDSGGSLIVDISQVDSNGTGVDVDFVCWGPYTSPHSPCVAQLDAPHIVSCSFSVSHLETVTIPSALSGEYYLIMATNYYGQSAILTLTMNSASTGSIDTTTCCTTNAIYNSPVCLNSTLQLSSTSHPGIGSYFWTGPNGFISSQQSPRIHGASANDNGLYYVNYTLDSTCSGFDSVLVALDTCGMISGMVYSDANSNCVLDTSENAIGNVNIKLYQNNSLISQAWSDTSGNYSFNVPPGNYVIEATSTPGHYFVCSLSQSHATTVNAFSYTAENFAADCNTFDFAASNIGVGNVPFFPGTTEAMFLYANYVGPHCGSGPVPGQVSLALDTLVSYVSNYSGCITPDTIINSPAGDTLRWNLPDISSLYNFNFNSLGFYYTTSTQATTGDTVHFKLMVSAVGDGNNSNDIIIREFAVGNSYDPNMKEVVPAGIGAEGYIPATTPQLDYTIHFQNTGTAAAHNIYILDTLDADIDVSTIKIISSSHLQSTSMLPGNVLKFNFSNIMLPDSNSNEPASHGFVKYSVTPLAGLSPGDSITNTAYIYFDYNAPVVTNTTLNTIELTTGISHTAYDGLKIFPNPASNSVTVLLDSDGDREYVQLRVLNIKGQTVYSERIKNVSGKFSRNIDLSNCAAGIYFIQLNTDNKIMNAKLVRQ